MQTVGQTWLSHVTDSLFVGHEVKASMTYIPLSSEFALYREDCFMYVHHTLGL